MATTEMTRPFTPRDALGLLAAIGICQGAGGLGAIFTAESVRTWYPTIRKPGFTPPSGVFGPVWTLLFLMMGVALFLVARGRPVEGRVRGAVAAFTAQLALNVLWSALFFGRRSPGAGMLEIPTLWAAILVTILLFRPISRPAAALLVPYLLWVSYAAALNFSIWRLNS